MTTPMMTKRQTRHALDVLAKNAARRPAAAVRFERALRLLAERQGYRLEKSSARTEQTPSYGRYRIVDVAAGTVVAGERPCDYSLTLDEVRDWLTDRA